MKDYQNFADDDEFQRDARDLLVIPWYVTVADSYPCPVDGNRRANRKLQQEMAIDTLVMMRGEANTFEEKIVRWPKDGLPYTSYFLEVEHLNARADQPQKGWMVYGQSDYLLYCNQVPEGLDCHLLNFEALQDWFGREMPKGRWPSSIIGKKQTRGWLVPHDDVAAVPGLLVKNFELEIVDRNDPIAKKHWAGLNIHPSYERKRYG